MPLRHSLQPHRLPYSADARIQAASRAELLLAARLHKVFRRIPHKHGQSVRALLSIRGEIDGEGQASALVQGDLVVSEIIGVTA